MKVSVISQPLQHNVRYQIASIRLMTGMRLIFSFAFDRIDYRLYIPLKIIILWNTC